MNNVDWFIWILVYLLISFQAMYWTWISYLTAMNIVEHRDQIPKVTIPFAWFAVAIGVVEDFILNILLCIYALDFRLWRYPLVTGRCTAYLGTCIKQEYQSTTDIHGELILFDGTKWNAVIRGGSILGQGIMRRIVLIAMQSDDRKERQVTLVYLSDGDSMTQRRQQGAGWLCGNFLDPFTKGGHCQ